MRGALRSRQVAAPAALLAVLVVSALFYRQRVAQHITSVDDYLYAQQTAATYHGVAHGPAALVSAWLQFAKNSPLVATLASPLETFTSSPAALVVVNLPLVLLLVCALVSLLGRAGLSGPRRWWVGGAVVVLPPVLTYTVMLNFSLAATLCSTAALALYLGSGRFRDRRVSLALGAVVGLLSLSRVVALVYVAALVLPFLADCLFDRADADLRARNAVNAAFVAVVVAAPWWLTAGPQALRYLRVDGYSRGTLYDSGHSRPQILLDRLTRTLDETGWLLGGLLALGFVVATWSAVRRLHVDHADERARALVVTAAVVVLGMLLLGTSSNTGTAFALPQVVLMAAVGAAGAVPLVFRRRTVRNGLTGLTALCLALSVGVVFRAGSPPAVAGRPLWLQGTPARVQLQQALGCRACPLVDAAAVNEQVAAVIGTQRTLILRSDAVLNPQSLGFLGPRTDLVLAVGKTVNPSALAAATFAVAGTTPAPLLPFDLGGADAALRAAGYEPVLTAVLSPVNEVVVWRRS